MKPFTEPWSATALRTVGLALAIGLGVGFLRRHLAIVPATTLVALWFTLGGHLAEVAFRNRIAPSLHLSAGTMRLARLAYWFVAGAVLYFGALGTWMLLTGKALVPWSWWFGGVVFIGLELFVHLPLWARSQPSFYRGDG